MFTSMFDSYWGAIHDPIHYGVLSIADPVSCVPPKIVLPVLTKVGGALEILIQHCGTPQMRNLTSLIDP